MYEVLIRSRYLGRTEWAHSVEAPTRAAALAKAKRYVKKHVFDDDCVRVRIWDIPNSTTTFYDLVSDE